MKVRFVLFTVFTLILFSPAIAMNVYAQEVVTDGLISYWPFDEIDLEARTVKDVWGNNHGAFDAAPELVPGKVGNALKFSGIPRPDDGIICGNHESLTSVVHVTLEFWLNADEGFRGSTRTDEATLAGISFGSEDVDVPDPYMLRLLNDGVIRIGLSDGGIVGGLAWNSQRQINANQWHHIVGTYDGVDAKIYIDGELDATRRWGRSLKYNDDTGLNFWISRARKAKSDAALRGIMDEVRVYNRALSDAEIQQNFAAEGFAEEEEEITAVDPAQKLAVTWGQVKMGM